MSYPVLELIRSLDLSVTTGKEGQEITFVEIEERLRNHMEDLRLVVTELRARGLRPVLTEETATTEQVKFARVQAHFAAGERAERIGAQRGKRMIEESREYAARAVTTLAPWLNDEEECVRSGKP